MPCHALEFPLGTLLLRGDVVVELVLDVPHRGVDLMSWVIELQATEHGLNLIVVTLVEPRNEGGVLSLSIHPLLFNRDDSAVGVDDLRGALADRRADGDLFDFDGAVVGGINKLLVVHRVTGFDGRLGTVRIVVGAVAVGEVGEFGRVLELVELHVVVEEPNVHQVAKLFANDGAKTTLLVVAEPAGTAGGGDCFEKAVGEGGRRLVVLGSFPRHGYSGLLTLSAPRLEATNLARVRLAIAAS